MIEESFREQMMEVHERFEEQAFAQALSASRALRSRLQGERAEAEQVAWASFSELKSLHALQDWPGLVSAMETLDEVVAAAGPKNHSYVRSLTMEACYHQDDGQGVVDWGLGCAALRLGTDAESFGMAVSSARNLLEDLGRKDLLIEMMVRFSAMGFERGAAMLAVSSQTIALELATEFGESAPLQRARGSPP